MRAKGTVVRFILFSYSWSFAFWLVGIVLSLAGTASLVLNENAVLKLLDDSFSSAEFNLFLLTFPAVYGPALAWAAVSYRSGNCISELKSFFCRRFPLRYFLQLLAVIFVIAVLPALAAFKFLDFFELNPAVGFLKLLVLFPVFLIYQLLTSATEEVGWRGFLLPRYLQECSLWGAGVRVGIIWALWHTPIVIYMFLQSGHDVFTALLSFGGFIAGTIGMSVFQAYYYTKTGSVFFSMAIHALFNTVPMMLGLLFSNGYITATVSQVLLWVVIAVINTREKGILDRRFGKDEVHNV